MGEESAGTELLMGRVGPRLRQLREEHGLTLAELSRDTGISRSTLSRLENGQRRPTLELLLALSSNYRLRIDDLVGLPEPADPRVRLQPRRVNGRIVVPLTRTASSVQAWKIDLPASNRPPRPRAHEGYEWLYVLHGRVRLVLGDQDLVLETGEAAEFDTRVPHWFGSTGRGSAELISLFGRQGERIHLRAGEGGVPRE